MADPTLEVRPHPIFGDAGINSALDKALLNLEPGKVFAVVAHVDLQGARLSAMAKVNDKWSFAGYLEKPFSGPLTAAAEVRFSV